jgi:formylglycine-generating enzyme
MKDMFSAARSSERASRRLRRSAAALGRMVLVTLVASACSRIAGLEEKMLVPSSSEAGGSAGSGGGAGEAAGSGGSSGQAAGNGGTSGQATDSGGGSGVSGRRPRSCETGAPGAGDDCGASGTEDCCESSVVEGGHLDRLQNDRSPASVSRFRLDRFEVTVARFRAFQRAVEADFRPEPGSGKREHLPGGGAVGEIGWLRDWDEQLTLSPEACVNDNYSANAGPTDHQAVTCVNYYQAVAFCIWDGGFLPTSAELMYVTYGGEADTSFPWGNELDPTRAVYATTAVANVGTKPAGDSPTGQSDLVGNVWEMVADNDWVFEETRCTKDCAYFLEDVPRIYALGASFETAADRVDTTEPAQILDRTGNDETGFRCARAP